MKIYKMLLPFIAITLMAIGCLKDTGFDNQQYGTNVNAAKYSVSSRWAYFADDHSQTTVSVPLSDTPVAVKTLPIDLGGGSPLSKDIHVKLTFNQQLVDDYNANFAGTLEAFDLSVLKDTNFIVTIKKGTWADSLSLSFLSTSTLDLSKTYGLGFTITSVDDPSVVVADNMKDVVFELNVKNQWDGVYHAQGYLIHPTLTGAFLNDGMALGTTGKKSVDFYSPYNYNFQFSGVLVRATIDNPAASVSTVTISASPGLSGNANVFVPTGATNTYDATTKTFYLHYGWHSTPTDRETWDTLTYLKPR